MGDSKVGIEWGYVHKQDTIKFWFFDEKNTGNFCIAVRHSVVLK
jgi:hypothetical protein